MAEKDMPYDLLEYDPEMEMECTKCPSTEFDGPNFGTVKGVECLNYTCTKCGYVLRMKTKDAHLYEPVKSAPGGTPPMPEAEGGDGDEGRGQFSRKGRTGAKEITTPDV